MNTTKSILACFAHSIIRSISAALLILIIIPASFAHSQSNTVISPAPESTQQITADQAGFSRGRVARSVFSSAIVDREPVDDLAKISNDIGRVVFFTDLRGMSGHKVTHQWKHKGKIISEV